MADRYWVGGSAIWDNVAGTKWATTSGGAGGASVPTSADDVYIDANSGAVTVTVTNALASCKNLSFTSPAGDFAGTFAGPVQINISGGLTLVSGMTRTFTGALLFNGTGANTITTSGIALDSQITFNGVGGSWTLQDNLTNGAARTVTFTATTLDLNGNTLTTGLFSSTNANARTLAFGTTGKIAVLGSGTTVWNTADVSNLTLTGSKNVELSYSGAVGTRTITASSVNGTEARVFNFAVVAGSDIVALGAGSRCLDLDLTGFSGTLANGQRTVFGSLSIGSATIVAAGLLATTFASTTSKTILTNGKVLDFPLIFDGVGGSWSLLDDLSVGSSRSVTLTNGTIDAGVQNVSLGTFVLGAGTKTLSLGSGIWTVAGGTWNANSNSAGLTVSPSTATINMTSASAQTFVGGGFTWPTLNQGGSGALTIQQSNSFANIANTVQPSTITLTSGTTQAVDAFSVSGTAGNLITLNASTPGSQATLSGSNGTNSISLVSIQDIEATGGATWDAFVSNGNVDAGNNLGWDFRAMMRKMFISIFRPIFRPVF